MELSIVIPAHNEADRIGPMLDAYLPFFRDCYGNAVEFIVVVNGSTDETESVVGAYQQRFPELRMIVEPGRVGKGGALMQGFAEAQGELIGFVDADGATPPEAFQDLVTNMGSADTIIASRWRRGADISPPQPLNRRIASRLFNLLVRFVFGLKLTDTQCGAKLFRHDALKAVLPHLGITRWAFDVDLLFQLRRTGARITEIATTWHDVAGSKVEVVRASVEMLAALTRLRLLYSPFRWVVTAYDRLLGPVMSLHEDGGDRLYRHSLLLLCGAQVINLSTLAFQMIMARMLNPAEFTVMAAMIGVFMIVSVPMSAFASTVSHFCAGFLRRGDRRRARSVVVRLGLHMTVAAGLLLVGIVLGRHGLAAFFKVGGPGPVLVTGLALALMLYRPLLDGVFNGAQAFVWGIGVGVTWGVARLVLGPVLVSLGFGAMGALSATAIATLLSLVVAVAGASRILGGGGGLDATASKGVYPYVFRSVVALAAYGVLAQADVVLVKRYFGVVEAEVFTKAATFARIIIFLPQPVTGAMFPKVVSAGVMNPGSRRTLAKAMVLVLLLIGGVAVFFTLFAGIVLRVLAGVSSPYAVGVFRGLIWALTPISALFTVMSFELAQRRFLVAIPLLGCAALYIIGVSFWHASLAQVILVLGASGALALVFAALFLLRAGRGGTALPEVERQDGPHADI